MRLIFFVPGVIWVIMIFVLLIMPGTDIPSNDFFELIYFDKWVHLGLFSVLTVLWAYPFFGSKPLSARILVLVTLSATAYGIAMEFVQKYYATSRSFDLTDMLVDAIGSLIGAFFILKFLSKRR
ncbi:VanZ family protein [Panacibacter ginsenosidivorans]|uniref:VanZ family protein n=2 Tax=Panacibacter ginsenosidivorans TaxID=1813871 RepID=A0A5B8V7S0_9BACT|nr:VanZ family protein [Panacibacter ginsenosidivorans]